MSNFVESLKKGKNLSFEESKALFNELMEGKYDESSIIEILETLLKKGETKDELAGGIFVLREKAAKVKTDQNTIDTCGTGGDQQNSLNISTAAAIVLASMGVKVAKHGNKAVSSNCGSADVLESLKIKIPPANSSLVSPFFKRYSKISIIKSSLYLPSISSLNKALLSSKERFCPFFKLSTKLDI